MNTQLEKYQKKIAAAKTKGELLAKLRSMDVSLSAEAVTIVEGMDEDHFQKWREGIARYMKGEGNPEEWEDEFINLLVPTPIARMRIFLEDGPEEELV